MLKVQPLMMLHGTYRDQRAGDLARLVGAAALDPAGYCGQLNTFLEAALLWCRADATEAAARLPQSLLGVQEQLDVLRSDLACIGAEFADHQINEGKPHREAATEPARPDSMTRVDERSPRR